MLGSAGWRCRRNGTVGLRCGSGRAGMMEPVSGLMFEWYLNWGAGCCRAGKEGEACMLCSWPSTGRLGEEELGMDIAPACLGHGKSRRSKRCFAQCEWSAVESHAKKGNKQALRAGVAKDRIQRSDR